MLIIFTLMLSKPFSYLFSISYFGARFKGWAKQPEQPTVEGKLERVLRFVLEERPFRMIGSSRTDSGVSCRKGYVQLFVEEEIEFEALLETINIHLGGEIRLEGVESISRDFNLIQSVRQKTYRYFFASPLDFHPFASAFVSAVSFSNSLAQMQDMGPLFIGTHNFKAFCQPSATKSSYERNVEAVRVFELNEMNSPFTPAPVFVVEVVGQGFLHHQVRKMVYAIWNLNAVQIQERLENPEGNWASVPTAPAHGLVLWNTVLEK
jgi:tRNA pseudouridine38-40 synthase